MEKNKFEDLSSERSVLSCIYSNGRDAFIETSGFLDGPEDFVHSKNRLLYQAFSEIDKEGGEDFGYESIKLALKKLTKDDITKDKDFVDYISLLDTAPPKINSLQKFCHEIKKYKFCRDTYASVDEIKTYLSGIDSSSKISDIVERCESIIINNINDISEDGVTPMFDDIIQVVNERLNSNIVQQMGIPTGFSKWDHVVGGGPRKGGTSFIMARPKVGKSTYAMNVSYNVSKTNIPVLYLDSELIKQFVQSKFVCIHTGVPINHYETGYFRQNPVHLENVKKCPKELEGLPISYENIAGLDVTSVLSKCRRWVNRVVGFNQSGKANDCLIVYDYFKLTNPDATRMGSNAEWLHLGLMLTALNTFLIKYEIPALVFGQTNRTGITETDGSIIAGSDRILWFCNDFSVLRNKCDEDGTMGCGWEHGNKKLTVLETRYGPGMATQQDYINLKAKIRPMCPPTEATGKIIEGDFYENILRNNN